MVTEQEHAIAIGHPAEISSSVFCFLFFIFLTCLHHRLSLRLSILKNKVYVTVFAWQFFFCYVCNLRINCAISSSYKDNVCVLFVSNHYFCGFTFCCAAKQVFALKYIWCYVSRSINGPIVSKIWPLFLHTTIWRDFSEGGNHIFFTGWGTEAFDICFFHNRASKLRLSRGHMDMTAITNPWCPHSLLFFIHRGEESSCTIYIQWWNAAK